VGFRVWGFPEKVEHHCRLDGFGLRSEVRRKNWGLGMITFIAVLPGSGFRGLVGSGLGIITFIAVLPSGIPVTALK
jgi:hypothetical protein